MKNYFRIPAILLLTLFLFACGQSGPLYVSGNPSSADPVGDPSTQAEDEEKDKAAETDAE